MRLRLNLDEAAFEALLDAGEVTVEPVDLPDAEVEATP